MPTNHTCKVQTKTNLMPQNLATRHLERHQLHLLSLPKADNTKTSPSMTGWQFLHSSTLTMASHKQVCIITSTPLSIVPLSLTKQHSHGISRSEKDLKSMQPHFQMQCQPNVSASSHSQMWIRPSISGSSQWRQEVRLWQVACCAQNKCFFENEFEVPDEA